MSYLFTAVILGLSSGLSPGPLLILLVSETLKHGLWAGLKVSLAPVFSDLPIVLICYLVLQQLQELDGVMAVISGLGGLLLLYMGYQTFKVALHPVEINAKGKPSGLKQAVLVNFLNPSPYLFWLLVGMPTVLAAKADSIGWALGFVAVFYTLMVASKAGLAILLSRSRRYIRGRTYSWTLRALALGLALYGLVFLTKAYQGFTAV